MSFEEHIKYEHNMWNYLYFIVLVRVKNKTDYTGPESYVAQMIKVRILSEQLPQGNIWEQWARQRKTVLRRNFCKIFKNVVAPWVS